MIYGYARVSTDGQSVTAQVAELRKHGAGKVFREVASGAKTDRAQLRRVLDQLDAGDVLMVTRLDRLARSTRDLLELAEAITSAGASVNSLSEPWANTTTPAGKMVLTVFAGIAEFERDFDYPWQNPHVRAKVFPSREMALRAFLYIEKRKDLEAELGKGAFKGPVLKEIGAICALIEHMADAGELLPSELQKALDLKNQQLEAVLNWPRPQTFMTLV